MPNNMHNVTIPYNLAGMIIRLFRSPANDDNDDLDQFKKQYSVEMNSAQSEIQNLKREIRTQGEELKEERNRRNQIEAQVEVMNAKIEQLIRKQTDSDYDNRLSVIKETDYDSYYD